MILEEAKMNNMTIEDIQQLIKKGTDLLNVECKKAWVNKEMLRVVLYVSRVDGDSRKLRQRVDGCLLGTWDEDFNHMDGIKLSLEDNDCPEVRLVDNDEWFEAYTIYEGGTVVTI